jgi:hypothetical protein
MPEALISNPVARQLAEEAHVTPLRAFIVELGFGVVGIDQEVPFRDSARVSVAPDEST